MQMCDFALLMVISFDHTVHKTQILTLSYIMQNLLDFQDFLMMLWI